MFWRPRSRSVALAALAFVLLATLAPLAVADHAYSHRYIVYGRVLDAENNPVPGLTVDLAYEKPFEPEGQCANQPGTETDAFGPTRTTVVTNQFGEYIFCFHNHGMSRGTPGEGTIKVESTDVQKRIEFDGFMRYSFVDVRLPSAHPAANKTVLNEFYTIQGRAWEATKAEIKVEGVGVYGDTLHNKPYNVTVMIDGQEPQTLSGTTNSYGDFSERVPIQGRPTGGKVNVTIEGHSWEVPIDAALGTTHVRAQVGDLRTSNVPFLGAPLAFLALAAVALVLSRRRG